MKYKVLYYAASIITILFIVVFGIIMEELSFLTLKPILIINIILVVIFFLINRKYKLKKQNILCPIIYLIFLGVVVTLSLIMNKL